MGATLRAVRMGLLMSQDDFARALRAAGDRAGVPNEASKRLVQRWEEHYVVVLQHGDRLTVRSLPGSAKSSLTMDLTVDGPVVTGTWVEQTEVGGHYRGARYHGAIHMLAEPTGRRIRGKWVGFGKDMDVNTGPWELMFQDASTNQATLAAYNRPASASLATEEDNP